MAFIFIPLTLLLTAAAIIGAFPFLFHFIGRSIGSAVRSRGQQRRELFIARADLEAEKNKSSTREITSSAKSVSSSLGDEWEKVNEDSTQEDIPSLPQDRNFTGICGFFHPFCNAGGGGERVLFAAIKATQDRYPEALCAVYTGDIDASKEVILENVRNRFNIHLNPAKVSFVYLSTRDLVLASTWPHFTLLGQSLGSLVLAWDAFSMLTPDIYIDTMGYAFTLALSKWLFPKMPTAAYVHYPTISTDMLSSLNDSTGTKGVNAGSGAGAKGAVKQLYWNLFAKLYSWAGSNIDIVMTNSSWTQNHINSLWTAGRRKRGKSHAIKVVYPPCAVKELQDQIPVDSGSESKRSRDLLYIAQFRPEKMHQTIIDAFAQFLRDNKDIAEQEPKPRLVLLGSVRDDSDEKRVYKLRLQAQSVRDNVEFIVNAKWSQILELLATSSIGVNGMWNEHFGIGVVEYQAAGLISVVNDSGGPREDIVVNVEDKPTGFRASTTEQFAKAFAQALSLNHNDRYEMRLRARKNALRFSEAVFEQAWMEELTHLVSLAKTNSKP